MTGPARLPDLLPAHLITEADLEQAKAAWRRDAPERFKKMLDAVSIDDEEKM